MKSTSVLDSEPGLAPARVREAEEELSAPSDAEIAELAYRYYEARGGRGGSPWEDWFRAEEELKRRHEL
jgi:DUF2934 family protein